MSISEARMPPRLHRLHFFVLKASASVYDVVYISSTERQSGVALIKGNIITLEILQYYTDDEVCRNGFFRRNRRIKMIF